MVESIIDKYYSIIESSYLLDREWYRDKYLEGSYEDPIIHYLQIGWIRNYNPSPEFDTQWYLNKYDDVREDGINPLAHYILFGMGEKRLPYESFDIHSLSPYQVLLHCGLFDIEWFCEYYSFNPSDLNVIEYYLENYESGLNPSLDFDTLWYLNNYEDVKENGINPFVHYVLYGKEEGRYPYYLNVRILDRLLDKETFNEMIKKDDYYIHRWEYQKIIIDELKRMIDVDKVLEIGPYKLPLLKGEDVIDIIDYRNDFPYEINEFIRHDCKVFPYPIEDKKYDLVIASQVLEHLGIRGEQKAVFDEIERISRKLILSLPYKWFVPDFRDHHMIDEEVISHWASGRKPVFQKIVKDKIVQIYEFPE